MKVKPNLEIISPNILTCNLFIHDEPNQNMRLYYDSTRRAKNGDIGHSAG